jgi:hypothetical protein
MGASPVHFERLENNRRGDSIMSQIPAIEEIEIPELERLIIESKIKPWTDREEAILRKYYPKGVSAKELSKYLERTPGSVTNKIAALGLERCEE